MSLPSFLLPFFVFTATTWLLGAPQESEPERAGRAIPTPPTFALSRLAGAVQPARPVLFAQNCTLNVHESLQAPSWSQLGSPSVQVTVPGEVKAPLPLVDNRT